MLSIYKYNYYHSLSLSLSLLVVMENQHRREFTFLRSRDFLRHSNPGGSDRTGSHENSMDQSQPMIKEMDFFSGTSTTKTNNHRPHDDQQHHDRKINGSSTDHQVSDPGVNVRFSLCY
jgi:hypothetical protein